MCSMNTFIQVLLGLTEVLIVLQCSLKSSYTNSQIYSSRNIFPTASRSAPIRPFLRTGLHTGTRPRPHRSVPTDTVLGLLSRCGRCGACLSAKSKDDLILKISSLVMILNSDVENLNIFTLSMFIGIRKKTYNTMNHLSSGSEVVLLKPTSRCKS